VPPRRGERLWTAGSGLLADGGAALPVWPILVVLCAASATTMVALGTRLTFFNDEWSILLQRPGLSADSVLEPHNGHLTALPVLTYKALVGLFGWDSQLPFHLALSATVIALVVAVFLFVRERAGQLLALVAAALLLFLGPAWEDLLWSFQIGLVGSMAAGIGVLLTMERDSPRRNILACVLLLVSVLCSDLGVSFVVAATLAVVLRGRLQQLWIPGIPGAAFAIWWLDYGRDAPSGLSATNVSHTPTYVLDSIASGLASLTGLTDSFNAADDPLLWGRMLLVLSVVGISILLIRGLRPSRYVLVVAAAAVSFWILAGANFTAGREPQASRYQLISATFLILLATELLRPVRFRPAALATTAALALIAIGANVDELRAGYDLIHSDSTIVRADLGALEITRGQAPSGPEFQLTEPVAHTPYLGGVTAGAYFREIDQHGSLADSPPEIAAAAPEVRQAADSVLAARYRLRLRPVGARPARGAAGCRPVGGRPHAQPVDVTLPRRGALLANVGQAPVEVGVRRFASAQMPIDLGTLNPGRSALLPLPGDSLDLPWHLVATGASPLDICPHA
jgi:hypothetical protein